MEKPDLIIVGASGNMGRAIIQRASKEEHEIVFGIVAPEELTTHVHDVNGKIIECKKFADIDWADFLVKKTKPTIIIDVTHKSAIKENWKNVYELLGLPLIVGTIGITKNDIGFVDFPVVIGSPNFAIQIADIIDTFENGLYPNFLKGIHFGVTELHQGPDPENGLTGKTEFSGTADKMIEIFEGLGGKMSYKTYIRDPKIQKALGVPDEHLGGHAWHTYHFMSPSNEGGVLNILNLCEEIVLNAKHGTEWLDPERRNSEKSAVLERWNSTKTFQLRVEHDHYNVWFSHNINGRDPYIDGLFFCVLPEMIHSIDCKNNDVRYMSDIV